MSCHHLESDDNINDVVVASLLRSPTLLTPRFTRLSIIYTCIFMPPLTTHRILYSQCSQDLGADSSPQTLARCAEFLVLHKQYEKAIELYVMAKRYRSAVEMCLQNKVRAVMYLCVLCCSVCVRARAWEWVSIVFVLNYYCFAHGNLYGC